MKAMVQKKECKTVQNGANKLVQMEIIDPERRVYQWKEGQEAELIDYEEAENPSIPIQESVTQLAKALRWPAVAVAGALVLSQTILYLLIAVGFVIGGAVFVFVGGQVIRSIHQSYLHNARQRRLAEMRQHYEDSRQRRLADSNQQPIPPRQASKTMDVKIIQNAKTIINNF